MARKSTKGPTGNRYDNRQKAKARRLYEWDGLSQESVAEVIGCSRKSIEQWMAAAAEKGDPWVRGKYSQEMREKEEAAKRQAVEDAGYNKGMVLAELGAIAFARINQFVDVQKDGSILAKPLEDLGQAVAAVKAIKQKKTTFTDKEGNTTTEVQLDYVTHGKEASLQLIGKELGMFKTDAENAPPLVFNYYRERAAERRGRK